MLSYIYGKIIYINNRYLIIDNNGIGWKIKILQNNNFILGESAKVYISKIEKLDQKNNLNSELFGFERSWDRQIFNDLLSIHGIGITIASNALEFGHEYIMHAVSNEDNAKLEIIKGINNKLSNLIIFEFKKKYSKYAINKENVEPTNNIVNETAELTMALQQLGYSKDDVSIGINNIEQCDDLSEMIKCAMKAIAKNHEQAKF
ncbi:MAG: Holliday junction branch migration protein RuvA [Mycoplasma sp.]